MQNSHTNRFTSASDPLPGPVQYITAIEACQFQPVAALNLHNSPLLQIKWKATTELSAFPCHFVTATPFPTPAPGEFFLVTVFGSLERPTFINSLTRAAETHRSPHHPLCTSKVNLLPQQRQRNLTACSLNILPTPTLLVNNTTATTSPHNDLWCWPHYRRKPCG